MIEMFFIFVCYIGIKITKIRPLSSACILLVPPLVDGAELGLGLVVTGLCLSSWWWRRTAAAAVAVAVAVAVVAVAVITVIVRRPALLVLVLVAAALLPALEVLVVPLRDRGGNAANGSNKTLVVRVQINRNSNVKGWCTPATAD